MYTYVTPIRDKTVAKKSTKAKTVKLTPTKEHPVPYDDADDAVHTFEDELAVAANTAELLEALGAPIEIDDKTLTQEKELIDKVIKEKDTKPLTNLPVAVGAASFLRTYGQSLALDVAQVRAALTTKLLEIADCGDVRHELRAIELLGKHSDIGLFTERSEITINYNSPESLEAAIKERVKRLLNADIIDVKPLGMDLDEELGLADIEEAEFEEVEEQADGEE
jgi:hypothetical protein